MKLDSSRAVDLLGALGIEVESENGVELLALCPMHKERTGKADHTASWWFNSETGQHICFSCGYSGGVLRLIVDVRGLVSDWGIEDYDAAKEFLEDFKVDLMTQVSTMKREFQAPKRSKLTPMTEARLAVFTDPPQWALDNRDLDLEPCRTYGVRWDPKEETWITPLRDPDTFKLLGFQMKGEQNRIFRNRPPGMKKSETLFGIDVFKGGRLIVVESPLDCVRILGAGIEGAVATCGSKVSTEQIDLMTRADEIILALDNPQIDKAGEVALKQFFESARARGIGFKQFSYGSTGRKDPGDMTDKQIRTGIERAVHSIFGLERLKTA